jgi:magnesium-transporting ATPase (P-type)
MNNNLDNVAADQFHASGRGYNVRSPWMRNMLIYHRTASTLWQFFRNFGNPFVGLLSALSMISFLVGAIEAGSLISFMVLVGVLLRFIQEFRSTRITARLRALVGTNVTVTRISNAGDRHRREIPLREVVSGDIIHLAAGDMIPADGRLLWTRDLFVSQSVLSGEALPVEKFETLQPQSSRRTRRSARLPKSKAALSHCLGNSGIPSHNCVTR